MANHLELLKNYFKVIYVPRVAREKSSLGIYHIMVRGINQQDIFEDDEDRQRYIETLERFKKEANFEIYAYCLMNNHVRLLIREKEVEISKILKKYVCSTDIKGNRY